MPVPVLVVVQHAPCCHFGYQGTKVLGYSMGCDDFEMIEIHEDIITRTTNFWLSNSRLSHRIPNDMGCELVNLIQIFFVDLFFLTFLRLRKELSPSQVGESECQGASSDFAFPCLP